MKTAVILGMLGAIAISSTVEAHTLRLQCKKLTAGDVVCRALFSDGDIARGMPVQLIDETNDKVLRTAKTDVKGEYAFKAPGAEYNVVVQASKGEVTSLSSEDIW